MSRNAAELTSTFPGPEKIVRDRSEALMR